MIILIAIGVLVVLIGTIIASGFVSASPGEIKVVSGPRFWSSWSACHSW